jgi:hypothetical protein
MRIAAALAHPVWCRAGPGPVRVAEWIGRAGAEGVDLLAFELRVDRKRRAVASFSEDPDARD